MSELRKELVYVIGHYGQVGITFAACIFVGIGAGILLDQKVFAGKTAPWFTFIGLAFGLAAGFKSLYDIVKKAERHGGKKPD
jgi:ATP synthase protein I